MRKLINNKKNHMVSRICLLISVLVAAMFLVPYRTYAYEELVIVIDPGHGGELVDEAGEAKDENGGANYHDIYEKDINLATAKALRDELSEYGNVSVYLTREDDTEMSLTERADYAKSVDADVLISVHYNASTDHNLFGSEIFTSAFGECYATGHGLASCIMSEWESYGNTPKDIKTRIGNAGTDYYGIIRHGTENEIPTIILEHGYIDNDKDYLRLNDDRAYTEMGICDATGIAKYYGLEKGIVKAQVGPTVLVDVPEEAVMPDDTPPEGVKLTITEYDGKTGDIKFVLNAYDDESKLMYYGFITGEVKEDTVFPKLELWSGKSGQLKGSCHVSPGYTGPITATVLNVYQLESRSESVELEFDESVLSEEEIPESDEESVEESAIESPIKEIDMNQEIEPLESDDTVAEFEIGKESGVSNKELAEAINSNMESTVDESLVKLYIIGLIAAMVIAIGIVLIISSAVRRKRRRERERTGYDWIDYD